MKARLVLEDGSVFEGVSIGSAAEKIGEVILNTSVVGYQEIMTDPANAGKIVVLTYPLIGNYGIARKFYDSKKSWINAVVIKEKSRMYSNWQAEDSLESFLKKENITALSEVDTRTVAVRIRERGEMAGIITDKGSNTKILLKRLKENNKIKRDFIKDISVKNVTEIKANPNGPKIAILDLGILNNFITQLKTLGCNITVLPYNTEKEKILELNPHGLIISGGPEQDEAIPEIADEIRGCINKIPMLAISLGHEILGIALGGRLKKMKLGHRGVNYPVKSPDSFKGEITVQNHVFIIDEDSIKGSRDIAITLRNVNDNSIEEMESEKLKFISTQYYPVSPGFNEVNGVFKKFLEIVKKRDR